MNIKTLERNTLGRDFVVGDLHGCFDPLMLFMKHVDFDPSVDRMFSVGDLVDRGPKNVECLELLREPWFHAVKGNHEDLMIDWFTNGPSRNWWYPNGGDWFTRIQGTDVGDVVRTDLLPLVQALPLMITVKDSFHVIHAEFTWEHVIDEWLLQNEEKFVREAKQPSLDGDVITWGRFLFMGLYAQVPGEQDVKYLQESDAMLHMRASNVNPIFCGHTPMRNPTQVGKQINMDTMAFGAGKREWAGLSFCEPATMQCWKVRDGAVHDVKMEMIV